MTGKYIDKELVKIASEQDVFDILIRGGEPLVKKDGIYRHREHNSLIITPYKGFYWFSQGVGSKNPIDYYMHVKGMTFLDATNAVLKLMNYDLTRKNIVVSNASTNPNYIKKDFVLPEKDENNRNVFAYLTKTRGLDKDLVNSLIKKGVIYQDKKFKNAVFLGKDFDGNIVSAFKRSTRTINTGNTGWNKGDQDGSQKDFRFRIENSSNKIVNIFESEIDMLSYLSLIPNVARNENYISLGGVSDRAIAKFLANNEQIKHLNICTDNDSAGHKFCNQFAQKYGVKYYITREIPYNKDFNEDLLKGVRYERKRIDVLVFEEDTKNMTRKEKIKYINDIFNEKYQGCKVTLPYSKININEEINRVANINKITRQNYRHKDSIETYKGFRHRLNMGVDKNIIELIESSDYIASKDEKKAGQNSLHKESTRWHYFNKPLIIENTIYNMVIDVRENDEKENYVHKIRLKELTLENEMKNDESSQIPSTGILDREQPSSNVNNNTKEISESQEICQNKLINKENSIFSFSKDEEIEF
ncbi:DUF3991 domain-containing protein [Eubacteriales bacterium KG125]